ncbi:uncharacterized protein BCR38DRAFT_452900, partial [Pseudomassariella vexata]
MPLKSNRMFTRQECRGSLRCVPRIVFHGDEISGKYLQVLAKGRPQRFEASAVGLRLTKHHYPLAVRVASDLP